MALSVDIEHNTLLFFSRIFNDHMNICAIQYIYQDMNQKDLRIMYRSMPLIDTFHNGLFRVCVQICDMWTCYSAYVKNRFADDQKIEMEIFKNKTMIRIKHRWARCHTTQNFKIIHTTFIEVNCFTKSVSYLWK